MSRRFVFSCMFLVCTVLGPLAAQTPVRAVSGQPLAIVVAASGDVTVDKSDGSSSRGAFGMPLNAGDVVRTGANGEAEILFHSGGYVELGPNGSMQVRGPKNPNRPPETRIGERSFEIVQNFLKLKDSEGTSALAALRSGDAAPGIRPETPCQTKIRDGRPTFRWEISDLGIGLRLTLYNEEGVQWKRDIQGQNHVSYPIDAPELTPGTHYSWTLETTDPLQVPPLRSQAAYFEVISEADREALASAFAQLSAKKKSGDPTYHLILASTLYQYGLVEEAIDETKEALKKNSDNPTLHSILARLYAEVGRTREAVVEYNRLLEKR